MFTYRYINKLYCLHGPAQSGRPTTSLHSPHQRIAYAIVLRLSSIVYRLSTIYNKCFSSLSSYPISILFGLFERARACALNFLTDFRNLYCRLIYDLSKT